MSFNRSAQNVQLTGGNLIIVVTDKKIRSSKYEFADGGSDGAGTSVTLQDVTEQGASTDRTVTFSNVTTAFTTTSNAVKPQQDPSRYPITGGTCGMYLWFKS